MNMKPIISVPMEMQLHAQLHQHQQMLFRQQQIALRRHRPEDVQNLNGWPIAYLGGGPPLPSDVKVELENQKLWQQFHAETTEMIITKSGRRMFPSVQITVSGLERRTRYCILLEVVPASDRRHKYVGSGGGVDETDPNGTTRVSRGWTSTGPAEPQPEIDRRIYLHPDSPATGAHWMQHSVSFGKLKITNNAAEHRNNVVLTSMHKYRVCVWIIRCDDLTRISDFHSYPASAFSFKETEFIAVTAYQNENITKLKIDNNPFAKGFRETGQSRCKRKYHQSNGLDESNRSDDEDENGSGTTMELTRQQQQQQQQQQRPKTASSESGSLDDSGVSSCGDASPPLSTENHRESDQSGQPRLHRPWTDDDSTSSQQQRSSTTATTPTMPLSTINAPPYVQTPPATAFTEFPLSPYYFRLFHPPSLIRSDLNKFHRFQPVPYYPKFH